MNIEQIAERALELAVKTIHAPEDPELTVKRAEAFYAFLVDHGTKQDNINAVETVTPSLQPIRQ